MMTAHELMSAIRDGDAGALKELYDHNGPWIATRLRRMLPASAVEDVLQETFVAVWRGAGSYRGAGDPGGWLWGIARRQAINWLRANRCDLPDVLLEAVAEHGEDIATRVDLAAALAQLNEQDRILMQLLYLEDRPVSDVAEQLVIPAGTVKSRAHRIRGTLRTLLGQSVGGN